MFSRLSSSTLKKICGAGCAVTTIYAGTSYGASVAFASSSHAALKFVSKARMIPHPSKANRKYVLPPHEGGEDAYFINDALNCVGVADGVGGWALHGVDAGIFARQLMTYTHEAFQRGVQDPYEALKQGFGHCSNTGSSTAIVLMLDVNRLLAANVGDSGFRVVRGDELVFASEPQQHSFNFPFQLAFPTGGDSINAAQRITVPDMQPGDIVVVASDGVLDNVFDHELIALIQNARARASNSGDKEENETLAKACANEIAAAARYNASCDDLDGPFALEASKHGFNYSGGKVDDITVIVSVICSVENE